MKTYYQSVRAFLAIGAVLLAGSLLSGCAAISTEIQHHHLTTTTRMSESIFLPPAPDAKKIVYVETHNATGKSGVTLSAPLKAALRERGFDITRHPARATYLIQVNCRQLGKTSLAAAQAALGGGYGGALSGALAGAAVVAATGGSGSDYAVGGLVGGAGSFIANSLVKDVTYTLIADVEATAKLAKGETATTHTTAKLHNGSGTQSVSSVNSHSHSMQYRTRIVATADKANLHFSVAKPVLLHHMASSIASIVGGDDS